MCYLSSSDIEWPLMPFHIFYLSIAVSRKIVQLLNIVVADIFKIIVIDDPNSPEMIDITKFLIDVEHRAVISVCCVCSDWDNFDRRRFVRVRRQGQCSVQSWWYARLQSASVAFLSAGMFVGIYRHVNCPVCIEQNTCCYQFFVVLIKSQGAEGSHTALFIA